MPSLSVHAGRDVRLTRTMDRLLVEHTAEDQTFEPFSLPRLAHSQLSWMQTLGRRMFYNAGCCLGLSLTLDVAARVWTAPLVPFQRCRKDGVSWAFNPREMADLPPSWRLGGSFQTVDLGTDNEELAALVPPFDGLHVVAVNKSEPQFVATFVRHSVPVFEGEVVHHVTAVPWEQLVYDDWKLMLDHNAQRLQVE